MTPDKYIGATLQVDLDDNRVLEGVLTVIDPFGNLLISNTYESSVDRLDPKKLHRRELGLVSIPRKTIRTIKMDRRTHEAIQKTGE